MSNGVKAVLNMKKIIFVLLILTVLTGCKKDETIGIIGGADGPTSILITEGEKQAEISPVRLIRVNGELYFDTGILSRTTARCGVLDGSLKKTKDEFEIPEKDGETNFAPTNEKYFGYQDFSAISKEVPLKDGWAVFKKIESYGKDLSSYKYAYFIKGRHPNAKKDSEYIVFANTKAISFNTVTKYFFSSKLQDHQVDMTVIIPDVGDEWGVFMYAKNVSDTGLTLFIEQFGGNFEGDLQTGAPYFLEIFENDKWTEVPTKTGEPLVWNAMGYKINYNGLTEFNIDFSFGYGKLKSGKYRISKEIMDFKEPGNFDNKTYYAEFEI